MSPDSAIPDSDAEEGLGGASNTIQQTASSRAERPGASISRPALVCRDSVGWADVLGSLRGARRRAASCSHVYR
jgi:hypothetical protein